MSSVKEHLGYRVWVNTDGNPGIERSNRPETPRPITTVHSRAIIRQQDSNGDGKYYQDRRIAFEDAYERWLLLYESKPLCLINSGRQYMAFWNKNGVSYDDEDDSDPDEEYESIDRAMESASYILEMSVPVHTRGRIVLESMCYTIKKDMRRGRFIIVPPKDERKLFDTDSVRTGEALYPLFRQCSEEQIKTQDFRVSCRCATLSAHPDAELIFVVYPRSYTVELNDFLDDKTFTELLALENVLLFKQNKTEKD
jgi:hypothetical protein